MRLQRSVLVFMIMLVSGIVSYAGQNIRVPEGDSIPGQVLTDSLEGKVIKRFGNIVRVRITPGISTPKVDQFIEVYGYISDELASTSGSGWLYLGKGKTLKTENDVFVFSLEEEEPVATTSQLQHPSFITDLPLRITWSNQ